GGFPVGMNGEDADLTMQIGRLGYRVVVDPRIRSYEDVPRVWFWTLRRGFSWFSIQAGLVAPIFLLELVLTSPTYRQNVATFALLYIADSGVGMAVSLPYAVKYGYWRAILFSPN
ncbi:MAG: hypothetical protein ACR2MP_19810, partial [Streptosporangiaceae bacterium]